MKRTALFLTLITLLMAGMAATVMAGTPANEPGDIPPARTVTDLPTCNGRLGENLLANPSFEPPFEIPPIGYHPDCIWGPCFTAPTAEYWWPWWQSHDDADPGYIINMPEYKAATLQDVDPIRVLSGSTAQQYFTTSSTFKAGVFQQVPVEAGGEYVFSAWGHSWTQETGGDAYSNPDEGKLYQMVGIHPSGSTDWAPWIAAEILQDNDGGPMVWGEMRLQYDIYDTFEVTATAQVPTITVVLWARPEWAVKDNNAYWEDACLVRRQMSVGEGWLGLLADVDEPEQRSFGVPIELSGNAEMGWTAAFSPTGTLTPTLVAGSGQAGEDLELTIDSTGYATGTYTTTLTITADPAVPGSPATLPVTLYVVAERFTIQIPLVRSSSLP